MTRIANEVVRREVPMILGSSTGASNSPPLHLYIRKYSSEILDSVFIVVVVVLVIVIVVSCSAIIYLLREDRRTGSQEARRRRRYNAQPLDDRNLSNPRNSRKWYPYLWGSRDRHYHTQLDKSATMMGRSEEGWIQANGREWDVEDFSEDRALQSTEGSQSGRLLGMSEHESSAASSFVGPRVYTHRMHSHTSDGASSVLRYDPHDVRGLPYPDQFPILPQATIPSIQPQLDSPNLSSRSSPVPRQIMKSPEPIPNNTTSQDSDHDSVRDSPQPQFAPPVLRTAGSGTKFFESF